MAKREKLKHGALNKTTSLSNCMKNTPRNGQASQPSWGIVTKISVSIVTEDYHNSESTEKYGLLRKMRPLEK